MKGISLRPQQVGDAKRFYEILNHSDFVLFPANPASIAEEKRILRSNIEKQKRNFGQYFSILYQSRVIGAVGVRIDQHRTYIGEVGYFVDRTYWGRGVAPEAVKQVEEIGFTKLGLERIELVTLKQNKASIRVAEKCGYQKEGIQRRKIKFKGEWMDAYLYARTKPEFEGVNS